MGLVFDTSFHTNGGAIFDNQIIEQIAHTGSRGGSGGGSKVRIIHPPNEMAQMPRIDVIEEEDELILQATAILLMEIL